MSHLSTVLSILREPVNRVDLISRRQVSRSSSSFSRVTLADFPMETLAAAAVVVVAVAETIQLGSRILISTAPDCSKDLEDKVSSKTKTDLTVHFIIVRLDLQRATSTPSLKACPF